VLNSPLHLPGCSRYQDLHAFEHYKETKHNYALELETQRVWDYAGDGYVHRLIQNKSDGKLVELPGPGQTTDDRSSNQFDQEVRGQLSRVGLSWCLLGNVSQKDLAKVDAVSLEYQYMLTAQLETQREWFEDQITSIEQQKDFKIRNLEGQKTKLLEQKKTLMNRVHQLELENQQFRNKQGQLEGTVKDLQVRSQRRTCIYTAPWARSASLWLTDLSCVGPSKGFDVLS
jgi:BRCA1-associated protein